MRESTHHKIEGEMRQVKEKLKGKGRQTLGDRELEDEGASEHTEVKVRRKIGEIKKVFNH
jgi:uncharacterized protein YjbJ (UPF0337 family)